MAITTRPDVGCENTWRHGKRAQPPAVAFVRSADFGGAFWTLRCGGCVASLAAANPAAARADVVYIAPDQPLADDDPQPDHDPAP